VTLTVATVRDRLDDAAARLAGAGIETPRVDAEWLLAAALGVGRNGLYGVLDDGLADEAAERFEGWVRRRLARVPLQHLLGTQAFRDLVVRVTSDVLVPRPETEMLVSWALELLPSPGGQPLVLDVGTGSGCIACALASERPDVGVVAVDASPAAVAVARQNVVGLGLDNRVTVSVSDLFSGLAPLHADLIVSNPPYIPTHVIDTLAPEITDHEPRAALDGGPDGLTLIRRLVSEAPRWLQPGAPLLLETAGDGQALEVETLMRAARFTDVITRRDLAGVTRFVCGRRAVGGA
jgi:release factor glutamine methyltransferase